MRIMGNRVVILIRLINLLSCSLFPNTSPSKPSTSSFPSIVRIQYPQIKQSSESREARRDLYESRSSLLASTLEREYTTPHLHGQLGELLPPSANHRCNNRSTSVTLSAGSICSMELKKSHSTRMSAPERSSSSQQISCCRGLL
jgi:hypothetical protein